LLKIDYFYSILTISTGKALTMESNATDADLNATLASIAASWKKACEFAEFATAKADDDHRLALAAVKQHLEKTREELDQLRAFAIQKHEAKQKAKPKGRATDSQTDTPAQEILRLRKEIAALKQQPPKQTRCPYCGADWGYTGCSDSRCPTATKRK